MPGEISSNNSDNPTTPNSVQTQVQDIFSDTDSSVMSPEPSTQVSHETTYNPYASSVRSGTNKKTIILIVGALVVLGGIAGAAILIYGLLQKAPQPVVNNPSPAPVQQPITNPPVTAPANSQPTTTPPPTTQPTVTPETPPVDQTVSDRDGDGLTDAEEATLHTNPDLPDTDNDGLTDREEVKVYKTNPLNADSDGDGYLDGQEVKGGYNPNGQGMLYNIK